jgi:hypothetical protein
VPFADVQLTTSGGVRIDWGAMPSEDDLSEVTSRIATYTGGSTASAPLVAEVPGITSATVQDVPVTVIDETTPARTKGNYEASWVSLIAMQAAVANTGVRGSVVFELIRGGVVAATRDYSHGHRESEPQTFGSSITFECVAGDRIRGVLQVTKLGAAAATARMAKARISITKLSATI